MNPYDFVRLVGDGPVRKAVWQHESYAGLRGRIICSLTARTHIFVPRYRTGSAGKDKRHETLEMCSNRAGIPLIPGTSLKGVIRSVAEAASNSCFTLPNRLCYEMQTLEYSLPKGFYTCKDPANLCPACRLFGMLNKGEVFAGNVSVHDALASTSQTPDYITLAILSAPKPRHKSFYSKNPNEPDLTPRGRKFYYHRPKGVLAREQKDGQNKTVKAVKPKTEFCFEVEYSNLTQQDLDLLLF
jgi:CRISPR/Cas system CSM-associated protein Csm3 (group 7 of RAMP superfamily)